MRRRTRARGAEDPWARWMLERRFGGDRALRDQLLTYLAPVRDRVLDGAALRPSDVVLDVGTGDGLIGFEALRRLGADGRVIFSDVSAELLAQCRTLAGELGVAQRCRFVQAGAERLVGLDNESVDVVTTRSVLIYVADKRAALAEFARVLRPRGRLSLFEPINRYFGVRPPRGQWWGGYDVAAVQGLADRIDAVYQAAQPPDGDPMLNFDDRDLIRWAEAAGFGPVELTLEVQVEPGGTWFPGWDAFLRTAPNPLLPTLEEALASALDPAEARTFEAHLRPQVEQGRGVRRISVAYLRATVPPTGVPPAPPRMTGMTRAR